MKTFEIFFEDLTPEAQQRLLDVAGLNNVNEANWDVFSLASVDILEDNEIEEDENTVLNTEPDFYRGM